MTFNDIVTHLQENWHKYGILYLVLKDIKGTYTWLSKIKNVGLTIAWAWNKIKTFFTKIL